MTIAISLKVNDGVILAADSATTLFGRDRGVYQVYNHANKVFNLHKKCPIGVITWGAGSIGHASISTLVKDFRSALTGDRSFKVSDYTVADVAHRFRKFILEDKYAGAFGDWPEKPPLGFVVAGYSSGDGLAEEYLIVAGEEKMIPLREKEESGVSWFGEPEAITRLLLGFSPHLMVVLHEQLKVPEDQLEPAFEIMRAALNAQVIEDAMPIQDAIDLAEFLVDLTEGFSRFTRGAATVGGPIEIAAITTHEGFKWVKRKYYYKRDLNPGVGDQ